MADPDTPGDTPPAAEKKPETRTDAAADVAAAPAPKKKGATRKTATSRKTGTRKQVTVARTTTRKAPASKATSRKTTPRKKAASKKTTTRTAQATAPSASGAAPRAPASISTSARSVGQTTPGDEKEWSSVLALWAPLIIIGLLVLVFVGDPGPSPTGGSAAPGTRDTHSSPAMAATPLTPEPPAMTSQPSVAAVPVAADDVLSKAFEEASVSVGTLPPATPPGDITPAAVGSSADSVPPAASAAVPPPPPRAGGAPPPVLPGSVPVNPWAPPADDAGLSSSSGSLWPAQPAAPAPAWPLPATQ